MSALLGPILAHLGVLWRHVGSLVQSLSTWKHKVEFKMVILAPFLIHLGALGRHPESNLVYFEAKMGSKRHLKGVSRKSFGEVFSPISM